MLTLILSLLACAPTCEDVEGAICEDELAALLEADTGLDGGWAWFDADGVQVTRDAGLLWEDADGVIWQVDPVGAVPYAVEVDALPVLPRFASEDCGGEAYVINPSPAGFAYGELRGDIFVWWGGDVIDVDRVESYLLAGDCMEAGTTPRAAGLWADVEVLDVVPDPGWASPLTLEVL